MSQVTKFTMDQAFRDRMKRNGFCIDDPDRRHPTRNDFPSLILNLNSRGSHSNANLLRADRSGRGVPIRARLLPWLAPIIGVSGWPDHADAQAVREKILHSPDLPPTAPSFLDALFAEVGRIDLNEPVWSVAVLGAILVTQTMALFQRRAMLRASTFQLPAEQPDLFPETIESERPTPTKRFQWVTDAATRQGQVRDENQDALRVMSFSKQTKALLVFDGAGGVGGGGEASQSAVQSVETTLQRIWDETGCLTTTDLETAIEAARDAAIETDLQGVTTALLILLDGDQMHYATLGDGAINVIWPDGMVGPVQVPHHTRGRPSNEIGAYIGGDCTARARTGTLRLEPGCFVLSMTDGASDLFNFEDFARDRQKYKDVSNLADTLLAHFEAARDPDTGTFLHSDNMTLAIACLKEEATDDDQD